MDRFGEETDIIMGYIKLPMQVFYSSPIYYTGQALMFMVDSLRIKLSQLPTLTISDQIKYREIKFCA